MEKIPNKLNLQALKANLNPGEEELLSFLCDSEHTLVINSIPLVACRKYADSLHELSLPL